MKDMQEKVEITLLGNEEKDYIMGLDVNGKYYKRNDGEELNYFLARATKEHYDNTNVNIFSYFAEEKYENIYSQKHSTYFKEKREAEMQAEQKSLKIKSFATKAAAVVVGVGLLGSVGCSKVDKNNETAKEELAKAQTEQNVDTKQLESKSLEELIGMLDEKSGQKEAIETIIDTKNYFNVEAAPSIVSEKDAQQNAQLYLTSDETAATYMYANILTIGPTNMNKIFGQSNLVWINKAKEGEEPIYELATPEYVENLFDDAREVLANYYSKSTEPSGISNLIKDEDEREFFNEFEALVLEYNRTEDKETKKEIQAILKGIFASNDIDALYEQYPGASALIARVMAPALLSNKVICEEGYNNIQATYRCEINDEIMASLERMYDMQDLDKIKNSNVVSRLIEVSNLDIIGLNRNINGVIKIPSDCINPCGVQKCDGEKVEKPCEPLTKEEQKCFTKFKKTYKESQKKSKKSGCKYWKVKKPVIPTPKDSFKKKTKIRKETKKEHIETNDRSEVEKKYSDEEIKKVEKEAKDKCEEDVAKKNAEEEERAKKLIEDNEKAQDEKVQKQMEEYNKTHPETYTKPVENTPAPQPEPKPAPQPEPKPAPQPTQSTPKTEVVKETYYDNDGNEVKPTSFVKKIKSIIVNGKEYKIKENITANSSVKVRS